MTEKRKRGRPATGQTPGMSVRVPKEIQEKAERKAAKEGRSVSDVVRECLSEYVKDD